MQAAKSLMETKNSKAEESRCQTIAEVECAVNAELKAPGVDCQLNWRYRLLLTWMVKLLLVMVMVEVEAWAHSGDRMGNCR